MGHYTAPNLPPQRRGALAERSARTGGHGEFPSRRKVVQTELPCPYRIWLDEPRYRQEPQTQWWGYDRNAKLGIWYPADGAWAVKGCNRQKTFGTERLHHWEAESRTATHGCSKAAQRRTDKPCRTGTPSGEIGDTHGQAQRRSHRCRYGHSERSGFSFRQWKNEETGTIQWRIASGNSQTG